MLRKAFEKGIMNIDTSLKIREIFVVARELKKKDIFSQETCRSQTVRYGTLKSLVLKEKGVSHLPHFL